jgi:hypothetical protein
MEMKIRCLFLTSILLILLFISSILGCSNTNNDITSSATISSTNPVITVVVDSTKVYEPVWIEPTIGDGIASIPLNIVQRDIIVHFKLQIDSNTETFMSYVYDGKLYVRGDDCVPCRSINFALKGSQLICMSCNTTFNAITGIGEGSVGSASCRAYPKEPSVYEIKDGQLVMKVSDLHKAFQDTLQRG